jgi:folylpolyglutamate synthase/dihydropteroate synthase
MFSMIAPLAEQVFLVPVMSERSADPVQLKSVCEMVSSETRIEVCETLDHALERSKSETLRVVTGSLHFIGEVLERLTSGENTRCKERGLNDWTTAKV